MVPLGFQRHKLGGGELDAKYKKVLPGHRLLNRRKVGTTSSHYGPYAQGVARATMGGTERSEIARWSKSQKAALSSDWSLQPDSMKLESLVIVGQQHHGEYVPGPCTHRLSSHES